MSRERAIAALREQEGFATGLAWMPPELLDAVSHETGTGDRAEAHANVAVSLGVDVAFVSAGSETAAEEATRLHGEDVAVIWAVPGVFGRVCDEIGWSEALRLTVSDPGSLAARLDTALHEALGDIRSAFASVAEFVLVADDLAGATGPLLSPDYVLDALMPCYHRLAVEAALGDRPAIFHSDGDIRVFFSALKRVGFAAVHLAGLDAEHFVVDAAAARAEGLVVVGGISAPSALGVSRNAGERAGAFAASLGGVIVCDDGGLTTIEQVAGVQVALDAAREAFSRARG